MEDSESIFDVIIPYEKIKDLELIFLFILDVNIGDYTPFV